MPESLAVSETAPPTPQPTPSASAPVHVPVRASGPAPGIRRADALRNREHILQVAHDAFAESGTTSLNAIAKRAGVGAGTLYRHFGTREDLVLAVYRRDVQRLVDAVPRTLAAHPPLEALRRWFRTLADDVRVKHGLGEALHTAAGREAVHETYAPVAAAVGRLLDAGERDGTVRAGLDPADVLLLMGFLWRAGPDGAGRERTERALDLAIEGLRARD
ncbi:TetR family transcriptional regulator [Streptomyces sp. NPDC008150]|uniref:TetR/AcrR family transcriptional regulator n=1 Tax=Streptomyces sp. NPDC008150 TaxID=3364816 RepID=UPI0036E6199A